jgi:hypothetical protein
MVSREVSSKTVRKSQRIRHPPYNSHLADYVCETLESEVNPSSREVQLNLSRLSTERNWLKSSIERDINRAATIIDQKGRCSVLKRVLERMLEKTDELKKAVKGMIAKSQDADDMRELADCVQQIQVRVEHTEDLILEHLENRADEAPSVAGTVSLFSSEISGTRSSQDREPVDLGGRVIVHEQDQATGEEAEEDSVDIGEDPGGPDTHDGNQQEVTPQEEDEKLPEDPPGIKVEPKVRDLPRGTRPDDVPSELPQADHVLSIPKRSKEYGSN